MRNKALIIALSAAVAILAGCSGETAAPAADAVDPRGPDRRVVVRTVNLEPTHFEERLRVTGVLVAYDEVDISSELGGFVREVLFDKGDRVVAGQVLARIGDDLAEAQLDQAEAELMAAETDFENASRLFSREAVPRQQLENATAERERAQARVREMEIRVDRSVIRSPITGVAQSRHIEPGEVVTPGAPVTTLQHADRLKVRASVPDTEIGWLAPGRRAVVRVDAYPDRAFEAKVRYLAPSADSVSRTFDVECDLPNREGLLRPGMLCRMELVRRTVDSGMVIPVDALIRGGEDVVAFVIEDCVARSRPVVTGATEGDRVLVESGLVPGDRLVVEGQRDLSDGQAVTGESCP